MNMKKTSVLFFTALIFLSSRGYTQTFLPLWPEGKKPNFNGKSVTDSFYNERIWRVGTPGMYVFLASRNENKGSSVLICPGGGYERLSYIYNGLSLAHWYNTIGVNAFVLVYRLPHQTDLIIPQIAPIQDAQRAMKIIRANAKRWNLIADKTGIMGTSAGGHLASTIGTHFEDLSAIGDSIDAFPFTPDFMVLLSPVITMGKYAHPGSLKNFIGKDSTMEMKNRFSNELQVSSATPPTFIVHALNDSTVNVRNSVQFYQALLDKKVNASIHIFPQGGHGIRLDDNPGSADKWTILLEAWLKEMNFAPTLPFK